MPNDYPTARIGSHVVRYVGKVCVTTVKDHFLPHEGNDHLPHALKHTALLGYSIILILVKALAIVVPIALPSASLYSSAITVSNVLTLTNAARSSAGLGTLSLNDLLGQAAQAKAGDMLAKQYFAHKSPDGRMPWDFIRSTGYDYNRAGENLAVHFSEAEDVQSGWMASPSHRANILNPVFEQIGIGVSNGDFEGIGTIFVVQMFGTPKTSVAVSEPAPTPTPEPTPVAAPQVPAVQAAVTQPDPTPTKPAPVVVPKPKPTPSKPVAVAPKPTPKPEPKPAEPVTPAPTPEPKPEPVVTTPVVPLLPPPQPTPAPVIDESSTNIIRTAAGYQISLNASDASSVTVSLGSVTTPLEQVKGTETWSGTVSVGLVESTGDAPIVAIAVGADGKASSTVLATIAPSSSPQALYLFGKPDERSVKLFGFLDFTGFEDNVKRFYAYAIILLAAGLLVNLAIKLHIRRPGTMAHALGVLLLAILLSAI